MTRIIQLDAQTANSIAAGEVVERPASVVKELVENALDAGASVISIEIMQGGVRLIRVTDNGSGMDPEDAMLAFGRHATSKLRQIEDLDHLLTMGFRGEALASIAAVAEVCLETRLPGADLGTRIRLAAGELIEQGETGCAEGTRITVENLFFNVPARFKFLRKDTTEAGYIAEMTERMALARPDVSFRLLSNQQELLHTPGNNDLTSAVYAVFGRQTAQGSLPVQGHDAPLQLTGLVGRPEIARSSRSAQCFYVNGRLIRSRVMTAALDEAYQRLLMKGRYAVAVLFLTMPPQLVDINVHPQKMEVRFWNDSDVYRCVYHAVRQALQAGAGILAADTEQAGTEPDSARVSQQEPASPSGQPDLIKTEAKLAADQLSDEVPEVPGRAESGTAGYIPSERSGSDRQSTGLMTDLQRPGESAGMQIADAPVRTGDTTLYDDQAGKTPDRHDLPAADTLPTRTGDLADREKPGTATGYDEPAEAVQGDLYAFLPPEGRQPVGIHALTRARLIGSLFQTYLLLEYEQELLLVDQHAAHEKIIYERLAARLDDEKHLPPCQDLLVPLLVEVSRREVLLVQTEQERLQQLGFHCDILGPTTLVLRSIPDTGEGTLHPDRALRTLLSSWREEGSKEPGQVREVLYQVACKAAVKAHDRLSDLQMKQLLADLVVLDEPYYCPHGRPVIIRLSRHELEKRFKRIV